MSSVGKDTVREVLENKYGYKNIVSYTSRPMRVGEIEGVGYNFVSKNEFENMINNNEMIEYRSYETNWCGNSDTWFYGVRKFTLNQDTDYVIVMDLLGAESIIKYFGEENCILVYLDASDKIREIRAINRGSFDLTEWNRRLRADYKDFSFANLQSFTNRYNKVWRIKNEIHGEQAINEIADVINFIRKGRLY